MTLKKEVVYEYLKDKIVTLQYEPGTILNEADLAEELGVSRTPIRDAMQRLEGDRLVVIAPRYGAQVPQIDFIRMKSLFDLTRVLDAYAAKEACKNAKEEDIEYLKGLIDEMKSYDIRTNYQEAILADEKFHTRIRELVDNSWLDETLRYLHLHSERLWHYCNSFFESTAIFYKTLGIVVEAFEEKNPEKAANAAQDHIDEFVDKIKNTLL